ncbi:hypothetical protein [Eubacterium limosum]|uniref:hypothetical protein n=1 Tax=Eubacterium limosum TaxID=1736 RepID=UPI00106400BE|nr:hypothetical protein [Eubacterium limosum]
MAKTKKQEPQVETTTFKKGSYLISVDLGETVEKTLVFNSAITIEKIPCSENDGMFVGLGQERKGKINEPDNSEDKNIS